MSVHYLENDVLKIAISNKGAALQSLYNKATQLEYLWNGDANFWAKQSPVLFPIVGGLKNNEYNFDGKKYCLSKHGFARDKEFEVHEINDLNIKFILKSDETTLQYFPFEFEFLIEYFIKNNKLSCKYIINNIASTPLYFSVGAHPAFKIPLTNNTNYNDWFLEFNATENCGIYPLNDEGLIKKNATPFFNDTNKLALVKELFYKDALVFKELQSTAITIKSYKSSNGLTMQFDSFPFYGIWSAKDADFVCLEPWCGIADSENTNSNFTQKEGILKLDSQEIFEKIWSITMF